MVEEYSDRPDPGGSASNETVTLKPAVQEWLRDNSVSVVECPDLNMPKGPHPTLTGPERICREEWQIILKSRCAKLATVIGSKGASSKYQRKGWKKDPSVLIEH